ncbi:MAG TPA: quinone-dependent dihydroorotate dehydrogenase [Phaeodactylibacter sp.]|nr:quinone-dependent dihydroorotate dehydrogenase [Phaeodactylibacter sp.]
MYKFFIKPFLFLLSPEKAHSFTVRSFSILLSIPILGALMRRYFMVKDQSLQRHFLGLTFPNPVGLAAGFDKDGKYLHTMSALGFGFIEVGTVTPKPQAGNPKPRLFRLPADEALINRMGFNNKGVDNLVAQLKRNGKPKNIIVGGNIGKNKTTPNERAADDYLYCFDALFPYVDYFVVNVSSPNTPKLRALQDKEPLTRLLSLLMQQNKKKQKPKPILLKIAPDLNNAQLDDILHIVSESDIAGIIATNTTISRKGLKTPISDIQAIGNGGLSGKPIKKRATEVIRYLSEKSKGKLFIIGVGGIAKPEDAIEKLHAGASLVQVFSGMVYEGPAMIRRINKALLPDM